MGAIQGPTDESDSHPRVGHPSTAGKPTQAKSTKAGKKRPVQTIDLPLADPNSKHPSERLPEWAKSRNGESVKDYAERISLTLHQDSLERSLRGDTAAHAKWREQALKGLGLGQRTELDITGRSDDKWLQYLTDAELEALETLHKVALQRMSIPQTSIISNTVQAAPKPLETGVHMLGSDNVQSVKFEGSEGSND